MTFAEAVALFKLRLTWETKSLGDVADRALSGDRAGLLVLDVGEWQDDLAISAYIIGCAQQVAIVYPWRRYAVTEEEPYRMQITPIEPGHSLVIDLRDLAANRIESVVALSALRTPRDRALALVLAELDRAQTKFPTWPTDPLHAASVLAEELGELQRAILHRVYEPDKAQPGDVQTEAVQTAAMALRFLLSLDRYVYARSEQHTQEGA